MDRFEQVALTAVTEAGECIRAAGGGSKTVHFKGEIDLVTDTDRQVEALVAGHLQRAFPDHLIVAEEASGGTPADHRHRDQPVWYLDPIDGTTNFAHGYPQFAVSLALAIGSELQVGVVHDPMRGETFVALRGRGARLNDEPIHVSAVDDLNHALLGTGFPYDRRQDPDFYLDYFKRFMLRAQGIRRGGSAALDLCYVACGRFDGFWEWKLNPWDTAAGVLIIREAGGTVTGCGGEPFDLYGQHTLASNGRIHTAMRDVIGAGSERTES